MRADPTHSLDGIPAPAGISMKRESRLMVNSIPSVITGMRLASVPILVLLVANAMLAYGAVVFICLLATDLLDGSLARRLGASTAFGAYFDAATDFILVSSMFLVFDSKGFVPYWLLVIIALFFAQFIITSVHWGRIHDPVGKHYGSLLYGAIGLRFILSGPFFSDIVTLVVTAFTGVALSARILYLRRGARTARANDHVPGNERPVSDGPRM